MVKSLLIQHMYNVQVYSVENKDSGHYLSRARILKHIVEAEKSTFQRELSFQRSECTAGLTVATVFCVDFKDDFEKTVKKTLKLDTMIYICILY